MNKRIYLVLEVKKRELDSRCYFAIKACLNDYEVVISKKNNFYRNKKFLKSGMVILKSAGKNYLKEITELKSIGHSLSVMDEEGLMYFSPQDFIQRRIYKENLKYIDYIFAWGQDDYQLLSNHLIEHKKKIYKTGSSRIDILKNPVNQIYHDDALKIKKKYGEFYLLNTFFTFTNHFYSKWKEKRSEVLQSESFNTDSLVYMNGLKMEKLQKETLKKTIEFVNKFAEEYPKEKLVIRPHMSENHTIWDDLSKKYENVYTVYDDINTCSWMIASNFTISSNCTTSVEAFLLKKMNYNFTPVIDNDVMFKLTKITGIQVNSSDVLIEKINNFRNNNIDKKVFENLLKENYEKLKMNMYNLTNGNCSVENMIRCFSVELNKKSKVTKDIRISYLSFIYSKIKFKSYYYLIIIKSLFDKKISANIKFAIQKFPDLTNDEVIQRINDMTKKMKIKESFEVKQIYPGAFLIKKNIKSN
jgi:surface carbohydrate biosynthesis protein